MTHFDDTLLNEYLDRQLDAASHERLTVHLAGCEACQARLVEAQQLFEALEGLPEVPLMVDLSRQIVARLSAEFKPRPQPGWTLPRWTFPIIALQLIAALTLFIWLWPGMSSALGTAERELSLTADQLLPDLSLSQILEPLVGSFERLAEIGQAIGPSSTLPIYQGFLIIGLALIFWLAGSGLLLRQSLVAQNKL
jgi:hypothetical protein